MDVVSIKCPNCGGELPFDPDTQQYKCPYCDSVFTQEEFEAQSENQPENHPEADRQEEQQEAEGAVLYNCPNCGAEIVTDATTAATYCYYCHNPVVLSGRVSGEYLPKWIIPFAVDEKEARKVFLEHVRKKRFVPKAFFSEEQIEKMTGVYFPYWEIDWQGNGELDAKATRVRVWRIGDIEYTETKYFNVRREGRIQFRQMMRNALKKANRELVEGVQPYDITKAKRFSVGYLSGFQAEKRDMERQEFQQEVTADVQDYGKKLLRGKITEYTTVIPGKCRIAAGKEDWDYVMVPVWTVTYRGKNGEIYYYAINGQNKKVCGKLPVAYGKLGIASGILSAVVLAAGLVVGLLL